MLLSQRPEMMRPGYARFQRASARGQKHAGSVRTQGYSGVTWPKSRNSKRHIWSLGGGASDSRLSI
jgi:hypothetical protein